eukprot:tig00000571_g2190.t1
MVRPPRDRYWCFSAFLAFRRHAFFLVEPAPDQLQAPAPAGTAPGPRRIAHCHLPGPLLRIDEAAARAALAGVCRALGIPLDPPSIGWHLLLRP